MHHHRRCHVGSRHVRLYVDSRQTGKENSTLELHNRHGAVYVFDRSVFLLASSERRRFIDRIHSARVLVRVHNLVLCWFRPHPVDVDRRDITGADKR